MDPDQDRIVQGTRIQLADQLLDQPQVPIRRVLNKKIATDLVVDTPLVVGVLHIQIADVCGIHIGVPTRIREPPNQRVAFRRKIFCVVSNAVVAGISTR